eukprot:6842546-Prymnesium_polylepis.1
MHCIQSGRSQFYAYGCLLYSHTRCYTHHVTTHGLHKTLGITQCVRICGVLLCAPANATASAHAPQRIFAQVAAVFHIYRSPTGNIWQNFEYNMSGMVSGMWKWYVEV